MIFQGNITLKIHLPLAMTIVLFVEVKIWMQSCLAIKQVSTMGSFTHMYKPSSSSL